MIPPRTVVSLSGGQFDFFLRFLPDTLSGTSRSVMHRTMSGLKHRSGKILCLLIARRRQFVDQIGHVLLNDLSHGVADRVEFRRLNEMPNFR